MEWMEELACLLQTSFGPLGVSILTFYSSHDPMCTRLSLISVYYN